MKVLITGGNGFVGLNIVEALLAEGHQVHALVRSNSQTQFLDHLDLSSGDRPLLKKIEGQLTDTGLLRTIMQDVDAVIHTAGLTSSDKNDSDKLWHTNVECTKNICEAMIDVGIKRLVYTSTTSTIGANNSNVEQANEETQLRGFRRNNPYGRSKFEAEQLVLRAVEKGLEPIILNPAEVVGRYDYNFQWGRIVLAVYHNALPFMPPGGGSFCHSQAVGQAHVNALTKGRPGERYILAGADIKYREYIETICRILDTTINIPTNNYWLMVFKAAVFENIYKAGYLKLREAILSEPPSKPLPAPAAEAYRMRVFAGHYYFSSEKARLELNYQPRDIDAMLRDSIGWYYSTGIISRKNTHKTNATQLMQQDKSHEPISSV